MRLIVVDPAKSKRDQLRFQSCLQDNSKVVKRKVRDRDLPNNFNIKTLSPLVFHNAHVKKGRTDQEFSLAEDSVSKRKVNLEPQCSAKSSSTVNSKNTLTMKAGLGASFIALRNYETRRQPSAKRCKKITFMPSKSYNSKEPIEIERKLAHIIESKSEHQTVIKFACPAENTQVSYSHNHHACEAGFPEETELISHQTLTSVGSPISEGLKDAAGNNHNVISRIGKLQIDMRQRINKSQQRLQKGYSTYTFRVNLKNR